MHKDAKERRRVFETLAMPLAPKLRATARRLARDTFAADDLVQEALLRAYQSFDAFEPGTNARAWLFTILYSVFTNAYRKGRVERDTMSIEDLEARFDRRVEFADPAAQIEPVERMMRAEEAARVDRALALLPEAFRSAVLLVDLEELSYEEAARVVDCPIGTLRSRLFRGRRALVSLLSSSVQGTDGPGEGEL